jgi:hypothetical protein
MILFLLLQAAAVPPAQPARPPATMVVEPVATLLASFDRDLDGRTTRDEVIQGTLKTYTAIEPRPATPLGYIGYSDWAKRWLGDANAVPSPYELDSDNDQKVSLAELQAGLLRVFDRLDRDKDGVLTRAETLTLRSMAPGYDERRGKRRDRGEDTRPPR